MPSTLRYSAKASLFVIFAFLCFAAHSHPNCVEPVDGAIFPPMPNPPLGYCTAYGHNSDGACCTAVSEIALAKDPAETIIDFGSADPAVANCAPYVKDIYCTWCNPYSGHNYESEDGQGHRPGPWLCQAFCGRFWDACSAVPLNTDGPSTVGSTVLIPGLTAGMGTTTLAARYASKEQYCATYATGNPGSCYTDNPKELETIPGGASIPMVAHLAYPNLVFNAATIPLQNPAWYMHITHLLIAPGTNRMFASFQHGVILSFDDDEASTTFNVVLDIQAETFFDNGGGSEYGVMGVSFHPNFLQNGWMYVKHSHQAARDRIVRYVVDRDTWIADKGTMLTLFDYQLFGVMHHGSPPIFGPDGLMYIPNGDGTNYFDNGVPNNPAKDPMSLLGKILRVNVDASTPAVPYTVPADNPFVNVAGWAPEIWAWGFRNPWRASFDEPTGRLYIGSVGQTMFESLYIAQMGKFHGWHTREGYNCYFPIPSLMAAPFLDCVTPGEVLPIFEFPHDVGDCPIQSNPAHCQIPNIAGNAIIGGYVYRGTKNPSLYGTYLFANYQPDFSAFVYTLSHDQVDPTQLRFVWRIALTFPPGHDPNNWAISTLGLDSDNEILIVNINNPNEILKFAPDGTGQPPKAPTTTPQASPAATPSAQPNLAPQNTTPHNNPNSAPTAPSPTVPLSPSTTPNSTAPSGLSPTNTFQPAKIPSSASPGALDRSSLFLFAIAIFFAALELI